MGLRPGLGRGLRSNFLLAGPLTKVESLQGRFMAGMATLPAGASGDAADVGDLRILCQTVCATWSTVSQRYMNIYQDSRVLLVHGAVERADASLQHLTGVVPGRTESTNR
jgi:hypothetical protein